MADAPDRIWSIGSESPYRINCSILDHSGEPGCTEYVRADIAASQLAEARAELVDQVNTSIRTEARRAEATSRAEAAEAERDRLAADYARLRERGLAFANQVRAVTYHLNGQAYSSTVSELNAFDSALAAGKE